MWHIREQFLCVLSYIAHLFRLFTSLFWDLARAEQKYSSPSCHVPFHKQNYSLFHLRPYNPHSHSPFTGCLWAFPHSISRSSWGSSSRWIPCIKGIAICYFSSQFCAKLARMWLFLLFSLDPLLPSWANKGRQIAASLLPFTPVILGSPVSDGNIQHPKVVIPPLHRPPHAKLHLLCFQKLLIIQQEIKKPWETTSQKLPINFIPLPNGSTYQERLWHCGIGLLYSYTVLLFPR